jgi:hypothetical protein
MPRERDRVAGGPPGPSSTTMLSVVQHLHVGRWLRSPLSLRPRATAPMHHQSAEPESASGGPSSETAWAVLVPAGCHTQADAAGARSLAPPAACRYTLLPRPDAINPSPHAATPSPCKSPQTPTNRASPTTSTSTASTSSHHQQQC